MLIASLITPIAFGQLVDEDEKGCIVKSFREQAYAPFRIVQTGDPAIKNSIEDEHQNPDSRWHLDRAEYEEPESPTILNFYTDSIDDWKFTVKTSYKVEAVEPRPITISYQANNVEFLSETVYRTGFDFCIIYYISVREAPHIFTEEEILETADKIQEENFAVVGDQINTLVKSVTATKDSNNIVNAIGVILIISLIISNGMQSRGNKQLKKGMNTERQLLAQERARMLMLSKQDRLDQDKFRIEAKEKIDNFIELFTVKINSAILDIQKFNQAQKTTKQENTITGDDGISRPETLHNQIEENKCLFCEQKFGFVQDWNVHMLKEHKEELKQKEENEKLYKEEYLGDGQHKPDILHLEEAKKKPRYFGLLNKFEEHKKKATEVIFRKEEEPLIKDEKYYIDYYAKKLSGHKELIEEYTLQNSAYVQTANEDAYTRSKALSILSSTNEKFDPRKEVEE